MGPRRRRRDAAELALVQDRPRLRIDLGERGRTRREEAEEAPRTRAGELGETTAEPSGELRNLTGGYAFYAPTGRYEPRGNPGIGRGHWTHQLLLGGALFFDDARALHLSALASYDANTEKRGVAITRGSSVQVQGDAGATLWRVLDIGIAGYALWQVTDDTRSDLPEVLRGLRDRAFGLGPEKRSERPARRKAPPSSGASNSLR